MITPSKLKKSEAKHILKLLKQITKAEILSRLGRFDNLEFADYAMIKIEKMNELLEYAYGTSSLLKLGKKWGLLEEKTIREKKTARKKNKKKRKKSEIF